ncbi:MAG: V-type ATP synthase subunit D [Candidatus Omnitrophota bacterium]
MAKISLTKTELRKQKAALKIFYRYLPTLQLKKQQLQLERNKTQHKLKEADTRRQEFADSVGVWVDVFAEDVGLSQLIRAQKVHISTSSIAGVDIPVLEKIDFIQKDYNVLETPLWVDYAILAIRELVQFNVECGILQRQLEAIREELRITSQRVNLFEKIKIPNALESIRKIQIALADLQTAAVVRGKIAKEKIHKKQEAIALI